MLANSHAGHHPFHPSHMHDHVMSSSPTSYADYDDLSDTSYVQTETPQHVQEPEKPDNAYLDALEQQVNALKLAFETSSVIKADKILHQGAAWGRSHSIHTEREAHPSNQTLRGGALSNEGLRRSFRRKKKTGKRVRFENYVIVYVMNDEGHVGTLSEPTHFEPRDREAYMASCMNRIRLRQMNLQPCAKTTPLPVPSPAPQTVPEPNTSHVSQETSEEEPEDEQDYDNISIDSGFSDEHINTDLIQINTDFGTLNINHNLKNAADITENNEHSIEHITQNKLYDGKQNTEAECSPYNQETVADDEPDYVILEKPLSQADTGSASQFEHHDGSQVHPGKQELMPQSQLSPSEGQQHADSFQPGTAEQVPIQNTPHTQDIMSQLTSPVYTFDKDPTYGLCISFSLPLSFEFSTNNVVVQTCDTTTVRVVASSERLGTFDRSYKLPMQIETSWLQAKRDKEGNLLVSAPLLGGKLMRR